ncbi:MAG TPA: sugar porter family MFS transporter [Candidatus Nanopelagicales bacterium]
MTVRAEPKSAGSSRVVLIAGVAALGGFLFGFDSSVINGGVNAIRDEFDIGSALIGFVVSIALLGSAVGAWFAGPLADRYGRIRVMLVAAAVFLVSAIGAGLPFAVWDLMFWRLVGGFAIGAASVIAPTYIAEVAPARLRGRLGSLQQLAIVFGIFVALLSDYALATAAGGSASDELWWGLEAWQWMFLVGVIPAAAYGLLALTIPESPRWLIARGRNDEARTILAEIDDGEVTVDERLRQIQSSVDTEVQPKLSDLRGPRFGLLPVVWVGILLSVFQQFVGINVIFYYSSTLWQAVGFTENDALLTGVLNSTVNIVATFIAIALIDRVGRKPLLLVGSAGMFVSLGTLTFVFATATTNSAGDPVITGATSTIALIAANAFVFFFAFSWGPVVWVLLGEMFPNRIRAAALSVAAAAQWMANFIISSSFPWLASRSLGIAYGIYTTFALLSFFFVMSKIKETKGRTLEDLSSAQ